jgi:hypothetical protein
MHSKGGHAVLLRCVSLDTCLLALSLHCFHPILRVSITRSGSLSSSLRRDAEGKRDDIVALCDKATMKERYCQLMK